MKFVPPTISAMGRAISVKLTAVPAVATASTSAEMKKYTSAYADIQRGQRMIFGENTYIVGVKSRGAEQASDLPEEVVRKLEDALARIAADPGEPLDGRAEEDE